MKKVETKIMFTKATGWKPFMPILRYNSNKNEGAAKKKKKNREGKNNGQKKYIHMVQNLRSGTGIYKS